MADFTLYNMDVLKALKQIKAESVDCIITSPPYWGLRDYGIDGQIGLEAHPKEWIKKMVEVSRGLRRVLKSSGSYWLNVGDTYFAKRSKDEVVDKYYGPGRDCGHPRAMESDGSAWLQPKQKMLMPHRLAIAMQDDGWILRNDCVWHKPNHMPSSIRDRCTNSFEFMFHFVKQKRYYYDLDAIREKYTKPLDRWGGEKLIAKGSSDWDKGTGQSTYRDRDMRPNKDGKNPGDAWKEEESEAELLLKKRKENGRVIQVLPRPQNLIDIGNKIGVDAKPGGDGRPRAGLDLPHGNHPGGKNPSDFWSINSAPYPEAHFACFPPALVERPLKATCPKQVCVKCGKARERVIEKEAISYDNCPKCGKEKQKRYDICFECSEKLGQEKGLTYKGRKIARNQHWQKRKTETIGFSDCGCKAGWQPGVVLDPFVGSGTTLFVAQKFGLRGIGIELNLDYIPLIKKRLLGNAKQTSLNPDKLEVIT